MSLQQIPLSWARRHAAPAVAAGVSLEAVFDHALITPRFGDDRDRISPLQMVVFHAALILETDDGAHAMLPERHAPDLGPLGLRLLFGARNLEDGLNAIARFYTHASRSIRLQLSTDGDDAFLGLQAAVDDVGCLPQEDIQLSYLYLGLTCWLGRPFPVTRIVTRDPDHPSLGGMHYAIRRPVVAGPSAGLAFPKALLGRRAVGRVDDFMLQPVDQALSLMDRDAPRVSASANSREFRVDAMATREGMAPSTYRRMMTAAGPGFRKLREDALLEATLELFRNRSDGLDDMAEDLGFSDGRSLRRFVKRVTGLTPQDLRAQLGLGPPDARLRARLGEIVAKLPN